MKSCCREQNEFFLFSTQTSFRRFWTSPTAKNFCDSFQRQSSAEMLLALHLRVMLMMLFRFNDLLSQGKNFQTPPPNAKASSMKNGRKKVARLKFFMKNHLQRINTQCVCSGTKQRASVEEKKTKEKGKLKIAEQCRKKSLTQRKNFCCCFFLLLSHPERRKND